MKKVYKMKDLDCANCAAKMERAISKIEGVEKASMNFLTQRLTLELAEGADEAAILAQCRQAVAKVDRHCEVL